MSVVHNADCYVDNYISKVVAINEEGMFKGIEDITGDMILQIDGIENTTETLNDASDKATESPIATNTYDSAEPVYWNNTSITEGNAEECLINDAEKHDISDENENVENTKCEKRSLSQREWTEKTGLGQTYYGIKHVNVDFRTLHEVERKEREIEPKTCPHDSSASDHGYKCGQLSEELQKIYSYLFGTDVMGG